MTDTTPFACTKELHIMNTTTGPHGAVGHVPLGQTDTVRPLARVACPGSAGTPPAAGAIAAVVPIRGPHPAPAEQQPAAELTAKLTAELTAELTADELLELYSRHADELAATVEAAVAEEETCYEQARVLLADQPRRRGGLLSLLADHHRRRVVRLRLLAVALGEHHGALDEATQLVRRTPTSPSHGAPADGGDRSVTVFGFADKDRVHAPQSGRTGQAKIRALTAAEQTEGHSTAQVVWDAADGADPAAEPDTIDLELAVAYGLEHQPARQIHHATAQEKR